MSSNKAIPGQNITTEDNQIETNHIDTNRLYMLNHPPIANLLQKDVHHSETSLPNRLGGSMLESCLARNSKHSLPQRDNPRAMLTLIISTTHLRTMNQVRVLGASEINISHNKTNTRHGQHMAPRTREPGRPHSTRTWHNRT